MINTAARLVRAHLNTFAHHGVKHDDFRCLKVVTHVALALMSFRTLIFSF